MHACNMQPSLQERLPTTSCAVPQEQGNIEIYVNCPKHVSAPNAESTDLCRLILGGSSTPQNCVCPSIHGFAPSVSVWTCCFADSRLPRSVTADLRNVQICEVSRRQSSHRTSGPQNFRQRCHLLFTEMIAIRWLSETYKILSNCTVLFCTVSQVLTGSTNCWFFRAVSCNASHAGTSLMDKVFIKQEAQALGTPSCNQTMANWC